MHISALHEEKAVCTTQLTLNRVGRTGKVATIALLECELLQIPPHPFDNTLAHVRLVIVTNKAAYSMMYSLQKCTAENKLFWPQVFFT
jgi:hypothetical protein